MLLQGKVAKKKKNQILPHHLLANHPLQLHVLEQKLHGRSKAGKGPIKAF